MKEEVQDKNRKQLFLSYLADGVRGGVAVAWWFAVLNPFAMFSLGGVTTWNQTQITLIYQSHQKYKALTIIIWSSPFLPSYWYLIAIMPSFTIHWPSYCYLIAIMLSFTIHWPSYCYLAATLPSAGHCLVPRLQTGRRKRINKSLDILKYYTP